MTHHRRSFPLVIVALFAIAADDPKGKPEASAPSFVNDVVPVLTRLGCNSGSCHGKLAGQNGFKLSLRGYAPELDHIAITRDSRGRRIAKSRPRDSLLISKPTMRVPHKGGRKLIPGSQEYKTLLSWIASGAPGPSSKEARVEKLFIEPPASQYKPNESRKLIVTAEYSDGSSRDVTSLALFQVNEEGLAGVDEYGTVSALRPGATAIMASFQGHVSVHVVTTPYDFQIDPAVYEDRRNLVDELVMAKLRDIRLEPSPRCDDATFLRRVWLDLAGTLPDPDSVVAFLSDSDPAKRAKCIDRLLESRAYVDYWSNIWGEVFQNRLERDGDRRGRKGVIGFSRWIKEQVRTNRPWDALVREILTARGPLSLEPAGGYFLVNRRPEDLAEATTHAFLGTRIQCAKCHNHPLERFTQDDYYGMAAFFTRVKTDGKLTDEGPTVDVGVPGRQGRRKGAQTDAQKVGIAHPRTGQFLSPRPLDRSELVLDPGQDPREALATWMTSPQNRSFARAIVNRVWKKFFAMGLVEPVDDLRITNPATNEPLLNALCDDLIAHRFDLKRLMRLIVESRTYSLNSEPLPTNASDRKFFSHYYPRRLPAEVLADAVATATGVPERYDGYAEGTRAIQLPDPKVQNYLLDTFGRPERVTPCACERSSEVTMPQILHLMNGDNLERRLDAEDSRLKDLLASGKSDNMIVENLFLATLARLPNEEQRRAVESALARGGDRIGVFRDLLWALVNSKEFLFNH
jgi:hypothetical protein